MVIRAETAAPLQVDAFQLAGIPPSIRFARRLAALTLSSWGIDSEVSDHVIQSLSEFVTNAVTHACPSASGAAFPQLGELRLVEVRLLRFERFLALEVWDPDIPPEGHAPSSPHVVASDADEEFGRGLAIVAALAQRWGVRAEPIGKTVFALFSLIPARNRMTYRTEAATGEQGSSTPTLSQAFQLVTREIGP